MRKSWVMLFVLTVLLLNGCQTATVEPTATEVVVEEEPTPTPVPPTEEVVVEVVDYCVSCHTDKEELIATAKVEEEEAEGESSGVG